MSVWLCLPSRRNIPESTLPAWREMGYRIAVAREPELPETCADLVMPIRGPYPGWPRCTNALIQRVMIEDPEASWFVTGGDDTLPDPNLGPKQIAWELEEYFEEPAAKHQWIGANFGVMQPTGDDWSDRQGRMIERIAGSPWMGREFCRRMYHGAGPLYAGFFHNFADEHLQCVAQKLGVFWQRPDLTHKHRHWARKNFGQATDMPEWGRDTIYSQEEWRTSQTLFRKLKDGGFKEAHDLLP